MISMKNVIKKGISTASSKEAHCHGRKKLQFFKTCLFGTVSDLRMSKHKTLVFLVLPEPFSVEKTFFGTTSGLNTTVQNIASPYYSKSCISTML